MPFSFYLLHRPTSLLIRLLLQLIWFLLVLDLYSQDIRTPVSKSDCRFLLIFLIALDNVAFKYACSFLTEMCKLWPPAASIMLPYIEIETCAESRWRKIKWSKYLQKADGERKDVVKIVYVASYFIV
ncbi:hypothetical protein L2E82_17416 [Cichorium intybus]|uniref:Uncharacterized protein n=1 Tax=Cichorium intybus TaxID=13427 RepID=A0ACB9F9F9_CICIN|nr:hypothetical protein L2E82_17416 [Cichorium intybus]